MTDMYTELPKTDEYVVVLNGQAVFYGESEEQAEAFVKNNYTEQHGDQFPVIAKVVKRLLTKNQKSLSNTWQANVRERNLRSHPVKSGS